METWLSRSASGAGSKAHPLPKDGSAALILSPLLVPGNLCTFLFEVVVVALPESCSGVGYRSMQVSRRRCPQSHSGRGEAN